MCCPALPRTCLPADYDVLRATEEKTGGEGEQCRLVREELGEKASVNKAVGTNVYMLT